MGEHGGNETGTVSKINDFAVNQVLDGRADTRRINHRLITLSIHRLSCVCAGIWGAFFGRYLSGDDTDAVHRSEPGVKPGNISSRAVTPAARAPAGQTVSHCFLNNVTFTHIHTHTDRHTLSTGERESVLTGEAPHPSPGPPSSGAQREQRSLNTDTRYVQEPREISAHRRLMTQSEE